MPLLLLTAAIYFSSDTTIRALQQITDKYSFHPRIARAIFAAMPDSASPSRLSDAKASEQPEENRCYFCKQLIPGPYYRVSTEVACAGCVNMAQRHQPKDTRATFTRAFMFGVGGAVVGMVLYAGLVSLLYSASIGYFSVAVGYMVGKSMMLGSNRIGGRRYQIVAVLLTYVAVSTAAIPIWYVQIWRERHDHSVQKQLQREQRQLEEGSDQRSSSAQTPRSSLGARIVTLLVTGLASPFLYAVASPGWGLIRLVILFIGLQIAWKLTQGRPALTITGPFDPSSPRLA